MKFRDYSCLNVCAERCLCREEGRIQNESAIVGGGVKHLPRWQEFGKLQLEGSMWMFADFSRVQYGQVSLNLDGGRHLIVMPKMCRQRGSAAGWSESRVGALFNICVE